MAFGDPVRTPWNLSHRAPARNLQSSRVSTALFHWKGMRLWLRIRACLQAYRNCLLWRAPLGADASRSQFSAACSGQALHAPTNRQLFSCGLLRRWILTGVRVLGGGEHNPRPQSSVNLEGRETLTNANDVGSWFLSTMMIYRVAPSRMRQETPDLFILRKSHFDGVVPKSLPPESQVQE